MIVEDFLALGDFGGAGNEHASDFGDKLLAGVSGNVLPAVDVSLEPA